MIRDSKTDSEVAFMTRIFLILLLAAVWIGQGLFCYAQPQDGKLIRVQPSYSENSRTPAAQASSQESMPTPREQMYVFWILGKVLSYPVDTAESYVTRWWRNWQTRPVMRPASAPAVPNPFDTIGSREIPPAPPVLPPATRSSR